MPVTVTVPNESSDTLRNRLAAQLGRRPTVAETKAEMLRVLSNPEPLGEGLLSADVVRSRLIEACLQAGSQKAWAAQHGVSQPYLSAVLTGNREPGDSILAALGLVREVRYCQSR